MALRRLVPFGVVLSAACSSSNRPLGPRGTDSAVEFIVGNQQSDTVQATLSQGLVTRVVNVNTGQPLVNDTVQFIAVADTAQAGYEVLSEPLTSPFPQIVTTATTDSSGECVVTITLGPRAGRARLVVKVPALRVVDTAIFTVKAGQPAEIVAGPRDSAIYAGHTAILHSAVADRFGNPRTEPVSYALGYGPATVSGSTVSATAIGRVAVIASALGFKDTTYLSVVPTGTLAASAGVGIVVVNLDGSGFKKISNDSAGAVVWAPSGNSIVFDETGYQYGASAPLLRSTTLDGTVSVLDNSANVGGTDLWPTYSANGAWIYYVKEVPNVGSQLWRVHSDGSSDAQVTMQNPPGVQFPSSNTDGSQVAYIVPGSGTLNILDVATGVSTNVGGLAGYEVSWSPTGTQLAYQTGSANLVVVNTDGSGSKQLGATTYQNLYSWSPDGQWVIAVNQTTGQIELLGVTSNLILPLGYTRGWGSPTWH